jgi:beta-N-acetylhexosaminidase
VAAALAGNDMIELPSDLDGAYRGLLEAAKSGVIPRAQIDASVRRILLAKAKVGLDKGGFIDIGQLEKQVAKSESFAFAQEVADAAVTLVRDDGHVLPLAATAPASATTGGNGTYSTTPAYLSQAGGGNAANLGAVNPLLAVLFVDSTHGDNGRMFERQIRARVPNATVIYVDARTAPLEADAIANMLPQYQRVVAAVYSVPQPGQAGVTQTSVNAMSIKQTSGTVLQRILDADPSGTHTAFVAMGSPYTILDFPNMHTYLCTFSTVQTSEVAAAKALFGEMPIRGKLPVTLTNIARRGEGFERPAVSGGGR